MSRLDLRARHLINIWAVLLLLLLPILSGCARAMPSDEPVTIKFAYFGPAEYYEPIIQKFNENYPHITVELDTSDEDNADVSIISPFDLSELVEEDAILSLDPFVEQDASFGPADFYPGTLELYTRDGRLWAVPGMVNMLVMYYNRDLFDAYGVPYPKPEWTWDDFLNSALAIRDPEADVFGYAAIEEFLDPLPFIYQHGGRILDDMLNPTRTTYDDPLTIEAVQWYVDLIRTHNVAPTRSQILDQGFGLSVPSGVYQGKVGMWTSWLSERGGGGGVEATWPAEWKMDWGMVPLPRDAQSATVTYLLGYAISTQAASPAACWQWIAFLSQQVQTPYGLTPARKSVAESAAYRQLVGSDAASVAQASMENAMLLSPALFEFMNPGILGQAFDEILSGRSTAEEALTHAQQEAEE